MKKGRNFFTEYVEGVAGQLRRTQGKICQKGSQTFAYWTLAVLKMKSDFHRENKKVAWDLS